MSKRILVVSQYFWPEDFRLNDLIKGLQERQYEVVVLTGLPNYPQGNLPPGYGWLGPYSEKYHGAKVIRVPLITRGSGKGLRLILNYLSYAVSASILGPLLCRGKFDAIFVCQLSPVTVGIPARLLGWQKKAPILFWIQDLWPESLSATGTVTNPSILRAVGGLVRWIYRGCTLVLVQSRAFFKPVQDMGVAASDIRYFPNSADPTYAPLPWNASWDGPGLPEGFRVMFAGNIGVAQSFETIVAAAELLKDDQAIHWVIVGSGRQLDWVRSEIEKRGLQYRVHLMGRHPAESMPSWFAQADVMLASLGHSPIFSLTVPAKVQSYLACGKPIIAAIDGEGSRVVEEAGAGIAVAAEDAQGLADAVSQMAAKTAEERKSMGEAGRKFFEENFSRELLLDQMEGFINEVAGSAG